MNSQVQQWILDDITAFYLKSRDFNGLPVWKLKAQYNLDDDKLRQHLRTLIEEGKIAHVFGDIHPNPHIRALPDEPKEEQLRKLESALAAHACAYPTAGHLTNVVDPADYAGRPYALELALGEPSMAFRAFDLSVLEFYRNDPRYYYVTDDISGHICIRHEYAREQPGSLAERDQIYLQSFGFCYDDDLNRAVAVSIHYLTNLTCEHQQMWKLKELSRHHRLHPEYDRRRRGEWSGRISIFNAFIEELKLINQMSGLMGRAPLFRKTFEEEDRSREFTFLIRPTSTEFNNFVQLLDKMMSDNINKKFFSGEVAEELEIVRGDGKIEVRNKGTITLLDEWLNKNFQTPDIKPIEDVIAVFKEVRQSRQKPAHAVNPNEFDQKFFHEQRQLMIRAYNSVRTIRLIFANWPQVRLADLKINEDLYKGNIRTF